MCPSVQKNIVFPQLNNALDISKTWKNQTNSLFLKNDNLVENVDVIKLDRLLQLQNNHAWLKNNKIWSCNVPMIFSDELQNSLYDTFNHSISTPPFLLEAKREHFIIPTSRYNHCIQYIIDCLASNHPPLLGDSSLRTVRATFTAYSSRINKAESSSAQQNHCS